MMMLGYSFYSVNYFNFFLGGLYDVWTSNGNSQIVQLYIPGVHSYSRFGYVLLTIINSAALALGGICISPPDMLFYLVFVNVPLVAAIVRRQMDELTALLRTQRCVVGGDITIVKRHFLHYISIYHKYNE